MLAVFSLLYAIGAPDAMVSYVPALVGIAYNGLLDGEGQTIGKRILRIRVVDEETGEPIGPARGLGRAVVPVLLALLNVVILALGSLASTLNGLWPLWDKKKQTWHDKAVRSVVVVA